MGKTRQTWNRFNSWNDFIRFILVYFLLVKLDHLVKSRRVFWDCLSSDIFMLIYNGLISLKLFEESFWLFYHEFFIKLSLPDRRFCTSSNAAAQVVSFHYSNWPDSSRRIQVDNLDKDRNFAKTKMKISLQLWWGDKSLSNKSNNILLFVVYIE